MQSSRFQTVRARLSSSGIRTYFRRSTSSASASSRADGSRSSMAYSDSPSPVTTINSVLFRQPSIVDLENEKRHAGPELDILEPRPIVYWSGVEERMGSF